MPNQTQPETPTSKPGSASIIPGPPASTSSPATASVSTPAVVESTAPVTPPTSTDSSSVIPAAPFAPEPIPVVVAASSKSEPVVIAPAPESVPVVVSTPAPTPVPTPSPVPVSAPPATEVKKEEIPLEKKNANLYKIGIALLLIILASTIGVFYMRTKTAIVSTEIEASPTPSPEVIPSPTPDVVALERDEIILEILNGTSTSGLAGKTAESFEELGYVVEELGNADDTESNQLYVKTEFADQLSNLIEDVESELGITEVTEEIDDLDVIARIILGGE